MLYFQADRWNKHCLIMTHEIGNFFVCLRTTLRVFKDIRSVLLKMNELLSYKHTLYKATVTYSHFFQTSHKDVPLEGVKMRRELQIKYNFSQFYTVMKE